MRLLRKSWHIKITRHLSNLAYNIDKQISSQIVKPSKQNSFPLPSPAQLEAAAKPVSISVGFSFLIANLKIVLLERQTPAQEATVFRRHVM